MKPSKLWMASLFWVACSAFAQADTTPPTITGVNPPAGATVTNLTSVAVTFSEPVTNLLAEDLLANGNPAHTVIFTDGSYHFFFDPLPYGNLLFTWDPGQGITDLAAPPNHFQAAGAGATWQYNYVDAEPPVMTAITPVPDAAIRKLTQIEIAFSEPVGGIQAADLLINGAPATRLTTLAPGRYLFEFTAPLAGVVQVAWAATHGIKDFAAVANDFAGGSWSYTLNPNYGVATVRINEFLAGNENTTTGLKDSDLELNDWIELYNYGSTTVNLGGYSLTDNSGDPGRWVFPSLNLLPGQYLVVFASGKDRKDPLQPHTNFRLSLNGDYLGLYNAESPREMVAELQPKYPEQRNDYSYGLDPAGNWRYYAAPTPGRANGSSPITSVVPNPHVNVARGLFDAPFTLIITPPVPGSTIRYTTDGSEPTTTNTLYTAPLSITNTTTLRVAAFYPNRLPSKVESHTYIFPEAVLRQPNNPAGYPVGPTVWTSYPSDYEMDPEIVTNALYAPALRSSLRTLPALSITMKIDDLFGSVNGIYTHPEPADAQRYLWERACSVEYILTNGATGFQIDCGVRMQGNASRTPQKTPKHPFRLMFKGKYGAGSLDYPLYGDSPVSSFETIVLRADFNNSWTHWDANQRLRGTRIRDAWAKNTARDMGMLAGHTRHFHLYLNGLYWGVYDFGERVDAAFAAAYLGGQQAEYDAIVSKPTEAVDGDMTAYNAMVAIGRSQPMTNLANYTNLLQKLDMPHFIDYMLLNFYGANQDWGFDGNWNAVRRRAPDGKFKYTVWDGEQLMVGNNDNRVTSTDVPSGLHTNLLNSAEYKLAFADRAHKHLFNGGALMPAANIARWQAWTQLLDPAIVAESARWGDYRRDVHQYNSAPYLLYTRNDHWLPEMGRMITNYFPNRHSILLGQLRTAGLYPANNAPSFSQHGGQIPRGYSLVITNNATGGTVYYTTNGLDPRVFGTGTVEPTAAAYSGPVTLNASATIKARHWTGTAWSALNEAAFAVAQLGSPLRFTEIMYNPPGGDAYEFIEIQNTGALPVDVSYFGLVGVDYTFPVGRVLAAGEVIVLASGLSSNSFAARYPGVRVAGYFNGNLANGGQRLAIADKRTVPEGNAAAVNYDDEDGWPKAADGSGFSLEILDALDNPDVPANWQASAVLYGTPGTVTPPPIPPAVRINEIMADNLSALVTNGLRPDYVELHNASAQAVSLAGWSLTDNGNPRQYVFPAEASIPAGGHLLVWCDTNTALPGLRANFGLGRQGDNVFLYDANTARVDTVTFGLQLTDFSLGRVNGEWQLNQPTPGDANQAAPTASAASLVINEWLANSPPGQDDWIELYNTSGTLPVSIAGLYLAHGATTYRLDALSFLAAGGYLALQADENPGPDHLGFKLAAGGGVIVLYDSAGLELSRVTYGPQMEGVTQGRVPDGSTNIVFLTSRSTPGTTNYLVAYTGPVLNEIMAINRTAVTNAQGRRTDWVEIYNPSAATFDLSGMRLSDDVVIPDKWVFPTGTSLGSNAFLVVWLDNQQPATTNAGAFLNSGFALDGEGDALRLFNPAGQVVDSVRFGFQVPDVSIGRQAGSWRLLAAPTAGAPNSAPATLGSPAAVRVNEWMASPLSGNDWLELYNPSASPVELSGLRLADTPAVNWKDQQGIAPLNFIGPGQFATFEASADVSLGDRHLPFSLDADGESIVLFATDGTVVDGVYFGAQTPGVSEGRLPDGSATIARFEAAPTPSHSNYLPLPGMVINEILTHTDPPLEDAIELQNRSSTAVNLSGWYLSDDELDLKKYRIPNLPALAAGGFQVFYENHFNSGAPGSFALSSAYGAEVWLSQTDAGGNLTGYRAHATVGPMANGVSAGRCTTGVGVEYVPLAQSTFGRDNPTNLVDFRGGTGAANAYPLVAPVVISEIMYEPPLLASNENTAAYEYLELFNDSTNALPLFDPAHPANTWRLQNAVRFDFPTGVVMAARSYLLVVSFDPNTNATARAAFLARYRLSEQVRMVGPWQGKLDNAGERIELLRPDNPQGPGPDEGYVPYLLVEAIQYNNNAPWPAEADGGGSSLQRFWPAKFGNDPINWRALSPTPGTGNVPGFAGPDTDADGLPDAWEDLYGFLRLDPTDALLDADNDGFTNYEEFLLGTHPREAGSRLVVPALAAPLTNLFVNAGQPAVFRSQVSGAGAALFQWLANDRPISGANWETLVLSDSVSLDTNQYRVVAVNLMGATTSAPVHLNVVGPPLPLRVTNGITTNLMVTVTGIGDYTYQWRLNGTNIPGATAATLGFTNLQSRSEGYYSVVVTDGNAVYASPDALVQVLYKAAIIQQPTPAAAVVGLGDRTEFSLLTAGSLPMVYILKRLGATISSQTLDTNACRFAIENIKASDAVFWTVQASNDAGYTNSQFFFLTVVTNPPASQAVVPGTNVALSIGVAGLQSPRYYQWLFNDAPLNGMTNTTLNLTNFQAGNEGRYQVTVSTINAAYTTPPAWVTLAFPPAVGRPAIGLGGEFLMDLTGNPGLSFAVEGSADLRSWTNVATLVITNTQNRVTLLGDGKPQRFYRVRRLP